MSTPEDDKVPRDDWLRQALRHAPDADAAPSHKVDESILRMGRAAVAPRVERPVHATPAPLPASGGWAEGLAALWAWLARPPVAAGFAGVMVATLVGVMWWGRSPEEMQPPQEAPVAAAPSTASERAAEPAAPPVATATLPEAARQAADASARAAATAAAEPPARKTAAAPTPAPATPAAAPPKAEAPVVVAAAPPAPAPAAMPAAPAAQNAATADMATRARESAERRDLAAAKSAAPAGAVAPQQAEAAAPSALAGRAAAASTALETPGFSNLRFEIRRKPAVWTWTRDDGAERPMDDATEAWIAQTDRSARTVWQAGAVGADQSTTTLRFTRDGVVRAVLRLGPTGMRLTRGGKTESAELSRGQAAALLSSLDALGP
jgi:hypothetical protein